MYGLRLGFGILRLEACHLLVIFVFKLGLFHSGAWRCLLSLAYTLLCLWSLQPKIAVALFFLDTSSIILETKKSDVSC